MIKLNSGVVRNLQVEVVVIDKKALVNVNEKNVNCWMDLTPVDENGVIVPGSLQSNVNVSYNTETETVSTNMNNITDMNAANAAVQALTAKIKEVVAELNAMVV